MIKHAYRYVQQLINGDKFLADTGNKFLFISQRPGKKGVNVTLQIIEDFSEPIVNKTTGEIAEDNRLETFDITVENCQYPLPFSKGCMVSLRDFDQKNSFYIDYKLLLRFGGIQEWEK